VAETAVVTGASSGVGRAISRALAKPDVTLLLSGRNRERLEAIAEECRCQGAQVRLHRADLCREGAVTELAEQVERAGSGLDVLVHCMGIIHLGPLESSPVGDLDEQFRANVRVPYVLTQVLLPALRNRRGQIVFINSTAGLNATAGVSQYAATKHALKALADSLREEVNPDEIRVLSIFLGRTATPMQEAVHRSEGHPYDASRLIQPDDVAATVVHALRLPRSAELMELRIRPEKKPL
jgi:short-subunit dehydrogenase